jgi:hypothetical protein
VTWSQSSSRTLDEGELPTVGVQMHDPIIAKAKSELAVDVRLGRDATESRRRLAEANLAAYIKRVVENAPPLSNDQRDRLATLLRGVA